MSNLDKFKADKAAPSNLDKFLAPRGQRSYWHLLPKGEGVGKACFAAGQGVFDRQRARIQRLWENALLYGGLQPDLRAALGPLGIQTQRYDPRAMDRTLRLNVVRRVTDAAVAQITRADVRPLHLPKGGNWSLQRKGKKLDRYSDGQMRKHKMRTLGPNIFRDACTSDMGIVKGYPIDGEPSLKRVLAAEIGVDARDARYGDPRQLFQRRWYDLEEAKALFPESAADLARCDVDQTGEDPGIGPSLVSQVEIIEGWVLPRHGSPGRHVICCSNATLLDEEWTRKTFPFAFLRYSEPQSGWHGEGMVDHLRGIQSNVNVTLRSMQKSLNLAAVPRVFIPRGSRIIPSHFTNEEMSMVEFDGAGGAPVMHPGVAFPPALLEHLQMLIQEAFDQEGVSRSYASSQKSPGVTSAIGIRTERDMGTERFNLAGKQYEQFVLDCDELLIEQARELTEKHHKVIVMVPGRRFSEVLTFKDVDIARDDYDLGVFPTSSLPATPQGILDTVTEEAQAGMIDASDARRLISQPNLDAVNDLANAPIENILNEVERLLDGEDYRQPEPYQDLAMGVKVFQQSYLKARDDGAPEEVLENLRLWIESAQATLDAKAAAAAPAPAPGGAPPLGVPGAPPTSPLLPTVPQAA